MNIFKVVGDDLILEAPYCEIYIPMYFFDPTNGYATDYVTTIKTLGVLNFNIFSNDKIIASEILNIPSFISLNVYDSEIKVVDLNEKVQCKVIKYVKGSVVCKSYIQKNPKDVMAFTSMVLNAGLPKNIPYDKLLGVWMNNFDMHGVNPGLDSNMIELIISVVARNPNAMEEQFNKVYGKNPNIDLYSYMLASIRQVCQYTATSTALTYEDMDSMITSSLNKSRNKSKESYTPIDDIMKY